MSFKLLYKPLEHEIDIVHAHAGNPPAPIAAYWYAKKKKKPFVVTYHGDGQWNWGGFVRRMSVYFYNKYLLDKILFYADVIISPSEYYIDESRFLGTYRDKIAVIPNGINVDEFDIDYSKEECREKLGLAIDNKIILFLGQVIARKGVEYLIRAIPIILKEVSKRDFVFIIVGSGDFLDKAKNLVKSLDIEKFVVFTGKMPFNELVQAYKSVNIFVLSPLSEGMPTSILEAMYFGLPVVATDIPGVKDHFKDVALLVPPKNEDRLAEAIVKLLDDEELRGRLLKAGKELVKSRYTWDVVAKEYESIYLRVLEETN